VYALVERLYLQLEISSTGYTADLCFSNLLDIIARCLSSLRNIQNSIYHKLCNTVVYKCLNPPLSLRLLSISILIFPLTLFRPLHPTQELLPCIQRSTPPRPHSTSSKLQPFTPPNLPIYLAHFYVTIPHSRIAIVAFHAMQNAMQEHRLIPGWDCMCWTRKLALARPRLRMCSACFEGGV
jgi:hypothetical protein